MPPFSQQPIRLLIADNHLDYRQTLRRICETIDDIEVVGESEDGGKVVAMADELQPDVIIMDIRMPILDGFMATNQIVTANPFTRVVILTLAELENDIYQAVQAGARCYLLKESDACEIVDAVRSVYRGEVVLSPQLLAKLFDSIAARSAGPAPG